MNRQEERMERGNEGGGGMEGRWQEGKKKGRKEKWNKTKEEEVEGERKERRMIYAFG